MVWSDDTGRRIRRRVKRRTPPVAKASDDASKGGHSSGSGKAAPGTRQEDDQS